MYCTYILFITLESMIRNVNGREPRRFQGVRKHDFKKESYGRKRFVLN